MRAFEVIREDTQGLDLSSYEAFNASLKRIPKAQLHALNDQLEAWRAEAKKPLAGLTELYHGTPRELAANIKASGFELTTGRRGGFMGAIREVQNLGVFLTDSKQLAQYFGANRAEGRGHEVLPCYVDTSRVLDSAKAPGKLKKMGLTLFNEYYGTAHASIPLDGWWWLLDKEDFVAEVKALGFTGMKFRETQQVRREAGAQTMAHTYCIFDPSMIKQPHHLA